MSKTQVKKGFSAWQLQKIRWRLSAYRSYKNYDGWIDVAADIIGSETNDYDFPEETFADTAELDKIYHLSAKRKKDDLSWPIQGQDLWRLVDCIKGLKYKKLLAIADFLIEEGFLLPDFFSEEELSAPHEAAHILSDFLLSEQTDGVPINNELAGVYECIIEEGGYIEQRIVNISLINQNTYFAVKEVRKTFKESYKSFATWNTQDKADYLTHSRLEGWANTTVSGGVLLFLKSKNSVEEKENGFEIYLIHAVYNKNKKVHCISLIPYQTLQNLNYESLSPPKRGIAAQAINILYFLNKSDSVTIEQDAYKNYRDVLNTAKQRERNSLSRSAAQFVLSNETPRESFELIDRELEARFLLAAYEGKVDQLRECIELGVNINCQDPRTLSTALHKAAARDAQYVVSELSQHEELRYCVQNISGKLPSALAWEIAESQSIGEFLQEKEIAEARNLGIDYQKLLLAGDEGTVFDM